MEILCAVAEKIAVLLIEPIGQWLRYSFDYKINIETLEKQEEKLRDARENVQQSVDAARRNGEAINGVVNNWLKEVDEITELAKKVLKSEERASTTCCNGACPDLKIRHQLSQKAKEIAQGIDKALEGGGGFDRDRVGYRPAPQGIVTTRSMDYVDSESRKSTVKRLMEALRDDNIHMLGVWGMAGVGKSTLVKEVAKQAKEEKLFDEVALANVTQSPNLERIQGEIADMLGLKFDEETVLGRASRLRERLSQDKKKPVIDRLENLDFEERLTKTKDKKKIFVILDDIWANLDLEAMGIPTKGCKVLLTSRDRDVLCSEIGTQKDFELEVLAENEAWSLFEKMAGDCVNKDPNLRNVATEVAKECAGLPLALVTLSKALKNKSLYEWKDALQQLRKPLPEHLTRMQSKIYSSIELSYKHLESKEVQDVFLLFPLLGYYIDERYLLRYCYGLSLFHGINSMEEARNRVSKIVRILKDCCLLLHDPSISKHLRMHDVVRDAAKLIASRDHNMFVVGDDGGQKEWPNVNTLKRCKAFSVFGGDIHELRNEMECPELRFLCMFGGDRPWQISDTSLEGMGKLRVLDLTKMKLSSLPSSLRLLKNLQTLCLDYCVLGDIAVIGELENLIILSLLHSDISQLPGEIRLLTRLRLLDLSNCSKLEVIPPNVLSSLVALEELYMGNSFVQWEAKGLNNASLAELKHLSYLNTLEIHITDVSNLPKDLSFEKLERYEILVGDVWDWPNREGEASRTLKLKLNTSFQSEVGIKMLLKRTENLYLDELKGVKSVINELDLEGFQQLKHLHIQNNAEIKWIINSRTLDTPFPALETILLKNMISLEQICHGQLPLRSFCNLTIVKVDQCDKLKFVFPSSIARGLSQLEELEIRECCIMGAIVMKEEGEIEDTDLALFPQLRRLALEHLPKLMSFLSTQTSLSTDDDGEIILEAKPDFYLPILHEQGKNLTAAGLEGIQHNPHRATWSSCRLDMQSTSRFQNLLELEVKGCGNIKYLLSFSTAKFMVHLKSLSIVECKAMEEILLTEDSGVVVEEIMLFPRLEELFLKELPILERFCQGSNIKFPSLKCLVLDHCPKLKTFIFKPVSLGMKTSKELKVMNTEESPHTAVQPLFNEEVAFPCLETLVICQMDDLKIIWRNQFAMSLEELVVRDCDSLQAVYELQGLNVTEAHAVTAIQLKKLYLYRLPKMRHVWNKDPQEIFSFQNLKDIRAMECESLKSLFPASVARCLTQLEDLGIIDCRVLEEIVAGEGGAEAITRFVFPQVTVLHLDRLPKLKCFYPGRHASEWPMLKDMYVGGCHEVDIFASQLLSETLEEMSQLEISVKQPLFLVDEVAFPSLEYLTISHMNDLKIIWRNQLAVDSFYKLQSLSVKFCENLVNIFQSDMLTRFQSLETLHVKNCGSLQEVFELEGLNVTETHDVTAIPLKELYLVNLPNMRHVWSKDAKPIFSFQNLQRVGVVGCGSLKSIFPAYVATCLTQLEQLVVVGCPILEEIVAGEEAEQPIAKFVFPQVTVLHLAVLPRLKWFYPGVHTSEWPMLKDMLVADCQKVEIFASELSSFQDIVRLEIPIKQPLFLVDEVPFPSLEKLKLSYMVNLKIIWHDVQFTADSFCKPQTINVEFCENLTFQETCAAAATQLKELYLEHLPKLKHIWNKDPQEISSLQNPLESMESPFPGVEEDFSEIEGVDLDDDGRVEAIILRNEKSSVFP